MARQKLLWQHPSMTDQLKNRHEWIFCFAALAVWVALGWPFLHELTTGAVRREVPVPMLWLLPFALFGAAVLAVSLLKLGASLKRIALFAQLAAVTAMAIIYPKDLMTLFLIVIAWQVAMATGPGKALIWIAFQTLMIVGVVMQAPDAYLSYIIALSLMLQLCVVFTAQALRREAAAARSLVRTNDELRAAQAVIANKVRDSERLRISRELHDAWGHELTALGLQLEIASNVSGTGKANGHVVQAKALARALLGKVRDVVSALREAEREEGEPFAARDSGKAGGLPGDSTSLQAVHLGSSHHRYFGLAALAVSLTLGWPALRMVLIGAPVPAPWLAAFAIFAASVLGAIILKLRPGIRWLLLCVQVAAVAAMAFIASWGMMSAFLIIVAWQVATATGPIKALGWVAVQSLVVIGALAIARNPDLCWVVGKSFALQLFFVFAAQALRMEAETARALARTNGNLLSAQAIIASSVRDSERLRISRELHDAWGHELTALGLQLEIASKVSEPGRANDHVLQAQGLARGLLGRVRDVVATLREDEGGDLKEAMETLARSVPVPAIHVEVAPGLRISPDQTHALIRCAQEAATNAVKHAKAANLWLQVRHDGEGVRLVARDDGSAQGASAPGSGLIGMRERVEDLGGRLAVQAQAGFGFTIDAWLPLPSPRTA